MLCSTKLVNYSLDLKDKEYYKKDGKLSLPSLIDITVK
ncbi:hypothetical protein C8P70_11536 [Myroides indicus]|uniref:Uncharacterized protein n=1 Tax=Myroides indicus TaxID=1323422 RepID=A0A4V3E893_9FLAO|nr:hypothetical protein C8P70_11536 [Myroides indicus]